MKLWLIAAAAFCLTTASWAEGDEPGHLHGPDGRHIVTAPEGGGSGSFILSHHDMRIEGTDGKTIIGAEVLSKIAPKETPDKPIHTEKNVYEPENEVYGSHLTYDTPGEYVLFQEVKLPDGRNLKVDFPVFVPEVQAAMAAEPAGQVLDPALIAAAVLGAAVVLVAGFIIGRRTVKGGAAALLVLVLAGAVMPLRASAEEDEEGHMHGPDGRHIVTETQAAQAGGVQLKAYPGANQAEKAQKEVDGIKFVLMIENEEMLPDPDLVTVSDGQAELIGLETKLAERSTASGGITTTGKVSANPDGVVVINSPSSGKVIRLGALPGTSVRRGQMLAVVQSPDLAAAQARFKSASSDVVQAEAGVRVSESELTGTKSELKHAQQILAGQKKLANAGEFASPSLEEAKSRAVKDAAAREQAEIEVKKLERQVERLRVGLASGVVAQKDLDLAEADLKQAQSRLIEAGRQASLAESALKREEQISGQGIRTAKEVQAAEAGVQQKLAQLGTAERRLVQAKAELSRARSELASARDQIKLLGGVPGGGNLVTIAAPIDAEVEHRFVSVGQTLSEGAQLFDLLNADVVWVLADLAESDIPRVKAGQAVEVVAGAYPDQVYPGVVAFVHNEVNPETRTTPVRIEIRNPGEKLKQNMFVQVSLGSGAANSVVVPSAAIQKDKGQTVVFVQEKKRVFRKTLVKVKSVLGGRTSVDGVQVGRSVAAGGSYQLLNLAGGK